MEFSVVNTMNSIKKSLEQIVIDKSFQKSTPLIKFSIKKLEQEYN